MAAAPPARTILITVDERASSEKLFDYAINNILRPGDKLHILHVINPCKRPIGVVGDGLDGVVGDDAEARCEVERRARQFLRERFERHLKELHVPFKTEIARSCCDADSIGELLCKRADQLNAAMVMLAKHKRGVLKTFFIGSVSNYMLSNCKQPVLVMQDS